MQRLQRHLNTKAGIALQEQGFVMLESIRQEPTVKDQLSFIEWKASHLEAALRGRPKGAGIGKVRSFEAYGYRIAGAGRAESGAE